MQGCAEDTSPSKFLLCNDKERDHSAYVYLDIDHEEGNGEVGDDATDSGVRKLYE